MIPNTLKRLAAHTLRVRGPMDIAQLGSYLFLHDKRVGSFSWWGTHTPWVTQTIGLNHNDFFPGSPLLDTLLKEDSERCYLSGKGLLRPVYKTLPYAPSPLLKWQMNVTLKAYPTPALAMAAMKATPEFVVLRPQEQHRHSVTHSSRHTGIPLMT